MSGGAGSAARCLVIAPLVALLGCQDIAGFNGSPGMDPGQDCMACHSATGEAAGLQWSVAGTIFPTPTSASDEGFPNAAILITDSATPPRSMTLRSNAAGNFYTAEVTDAPFQVSVQFAGQRYQMQEEAPVGSCNLCHDIAQGTSTALPLPPPYLDAGYNYGMPASGRLFVPSLGLMRGLMRGLMLVQTPVPLEDRLEAPGWPDGHRGPCLRLRQRGEARCFRHRRLPSRFGLPVRIHLSARRLPAIRPDLSHRC